jgi:hypothetical protein
MEYKELTLLLKDYDQEKVNVYLGYLRQLETDKDRNKQLKNKWFGFFKASQAAALYKKVAIDNIYIDGDTVTLANKGKVMANYNYQAYKNKLLNVYPESKFDLQIVREGDTFEFKKESGKVIYTHVFGSPFKLKDKTIGTYCIIKNNRGEFIEFLNMDEVAKMKNVAMTKNIWNTWEDEMILKSVIKRACKRHFKDVVTNMESIDNENYDLENVDLDSEVQGKIEKATTAKELMDIYTLNKGKLKDETAFLNLLSEKRKELEDENT